MSTMPDPSFKQQTWTPTTYTVEHEFKYDLTTGELHHFIDEHVRHVVELRNQLEDEIVLRAIVIELERKGYTITSPGVPAPVFHDVVFYRDELGHKYVGKESNRESVEAMQYALDQFLNT